MFFFFCKQKTAYEMRISDWSSDVCSSDLRGGVLVSSDRRAASGRRQALKHGPPCGCPGASAPPLHGRSGRGAAQMQPAPRRDQAMVSSAFRSEEHTSELQSLMRISYAVFCLKTETYKVLSNTSRITSH